MKTTLPIEIITLEDESYHIMIEVTLSKQLKGDLIIDTGASKSVFDKQFVSEYIEDIEDVEDNNSSGINAMLSEAQAGTLPSLLFNELELNNYKCILLDLSHINSFYKKHTNKQIAGLIGSDFLLKYNAVIDYKKATLTISE